MRVVKKKVSINEKFISRKIFHGGNTYYHTGFMNKNYHTDPLGVFSMREICIHNNDGVLFNGGFRKIV